MLARQPMSTRMPSTVCAVVGSGWLLRGNAYSTPLRRTPKSRGFLHDETGCYRCRGRRAHKLRKPANDGSHSGHHIKDEFIRRDKHSQQHATGGAWLNVGKTQRKKTSPTYLETPGLTFAVMHMPASRVFIAVLNIMPVGNLERLVEPERIRTL